MKRGTRQEKGVCVWLRLKGTKCTGTTDENPLHCKDLGDPNPVFKVRVDVHVHTKVRTDVYANERKDEMKRHEDRET